GVWDQSPMARTLTRHTNCHTPNGRRPGGGYLEGIGRSRRFSEGVKLLSKLEFQVSSRMNPLLQDIRHTPLLWLLVFVPVVFSAAKFRPEAQTLLFVLSVLAIVPLTVLLSHATESVAAKIGDALGGLLNATLGNLAELIIALTALRAGQFMLVKASIAGPIVTNTLFILGTSFLLGGLRHHEQEYNRVSARMQASLLFIAAVALLIPSAVSQADSAAQAAFTHR